MAENRYYQLLGIPEDIKVPNYYQLLGLNFKVREERDIQAAFMAQMKKLQHIKSSKHKGFIEFLKAELKEARKTLAEPNKRAEYDRDLISDRISEFKNIVEPVLMSGHLTYKTIENLCKHGVRLGFSPNDATEFISREAARLGVQLLPPGGATEAGPEAGPAKPDVGPAKPDVGSVKPDVGPARPAARAPESAPAPRRPSPSERNPALPAVQAAGGPAAEASQSDGVHSRPAAAATGRAQPQNRDPAGSGSGPHPAVRPAEPAEARRPTERSGDPREESSSGEFAAFHAERSRPAPRAEGVDFGRPRVAGPVPDGHAPPSPGPERTRPEIARRPAEAGPDAIPMRRPPVGPAPAPGALSPQPRRPAAPGPAEIRRPPPRPGDQAPTARPEPVRARPAPAAAPAPVAPGADAEPAGGSRLSRAHQERWIEQEQKRNQAKAIREYNRAIIASKNAMARHDELKSYFPPHHGGHRVIEEIKGKHYTQVFEEEMRAFKEARDLFVLHCKLLDQIGSPKGRRTRDIAEAHIQEIDVYLTQCQELKKALHSHPSPQEELRLWLRFVQAARSRALTTRLQLTTRS